MSDASQRFVVRYVWPPILIAVVLGTIAVFSVVAQEAWLAPSLALAVFSQMLHPDESGAEPVNIAVGPAIGIVAGFFGVWLAGAAHAPSLTGDHNLVYGRALAVVIAVVVAPSCSCRPASAPRPAAPPRSSPPSASRRSLSAAPCA